MKRNRKVRRQGVSVKLTNIRDLPAIAAFPAGKYAIGVECVSNTFTSTAAEGYVYFIDVQQCTRREGLEKFVIQRSVKERTYVI